MGMNALVEKLGQTYDSLVGKKKKTVKKKIKKGTQKKGTQYSNITNPSDQSVAGRLRAANARKRKAMEDASKY